MAKPIGPIVVGRPVPIEKRVRAKELRSTATPAERLLWQQLRAHRLQGFHFRRQQIISGFIVDFYCHAHGLAIELDGEVHQQQQHYDAERDEVLTALGIKVLRFPNRMVQTQLFQVLEQIIAGCNS